MIWQGVEVIAAQDVTTVLSRLSSKAEAKEFMRAYKKEIGNDAARINVGYCIVYVQGIERRKELLSWCNVVHPIFGTNVSPNENELRAIIEDLHYRVAGMTNGELEVADLIVHQQPPEDLTEKIRNILRD